MKIQAVNLLNFGELETDKEGHETSKESPSGYVLRPDTINFIQQTDRLIGKKGLRFGIEYYLKGFDDRQDDVEFFCKISHPIMHDPKTDRELVEITERKLNYLNQKNFDYYCFEFEWEIVRGTWIFEVIEDNRVLLRKKFEIE